MIAEALLEKPRVVEPFMPTWLAKEDLPTMEGLPIMEGLPTMEDLPSEYPGDPGMPDLFHVWQTNLLSQTFRPPDYPFDQMLIASDLNLYYDVQNTLWHKRPDWYTVLGVPRFYKGILDELRPSYVIWQEHIPPFLVVELLSSSTEAEDLGKTKRKKGEPPTKWEVYEQILGVPYYVVFSRRTDKLRAFELVGRKYREMMLPKNRLWFPQLKLGLGVWKGNYEGAVRKWLRWYDTDEDWLLTPVEQTEQQRQYAEQERQHAQRERQRAEQERQHAEQQRQRAEQEHQRNERLIAQLKALGIEPEV